MDAGDARVLGDRGARVLGEPSQPEAVVAAVQLAAAVDPHAGQDRRRRGTVVDLQSGQPGRDGSLGLALQLDDLRRVARVGERRAVLPIAGDPLRLDEIPDPVDGGLIGLGVEARPFGPDAAPERAVPQAVGSGDLARGRAGHPGPDAPSFEYENALPPAGEQQRHRQPEDPRADDEDVDRVVARTNGSERPGRRWRGGCVPQRDGRGIGHERSGDE